MTAIQTTLIASCLLGLLCGIFGSFVVVRRMALTGDMLAHAILPGIVVAIILSPTRNPLVILGCALAAGFLGSSAMNHLLHRTRLKPDAVLALLLSVFFAIGIALISHFQTPGVQAFLFGQMAAVNAADLKLLFIITLTVLILLPFFYRHIHLLAFDPSYARLIGLPVKLIDALFFLLLTLVIVAAMQAVGVILVTAFLITPVVAAKYFARSLGRIICISVAIGIIAASAGVLISASRPTLPTGPVITLLLTFLCLAAALLGPVRGRLPAFLRRRRERERILGEDVLKQLWHHEQGRPTNPLTFPDISSKTLSRLVGRESISHQNKAYMLTAEGREQATELVRAHRLWETYLTRHAAYKADHVHDDAERAEHWIDPELRRRLEEKLGHPQSDPHGSPIPENPTKP
jgi:manganese/zinc/iron transport system permease protein